MFHWSTFWAIIPMLKGKQQHHPEFSHLRNGSANRQHKGAQLYRCEITHNDTTMDWEEPQNKGMSTLEDKVKGSPVAGTISRQPNVTGNKSHARPWQGVWLATKKQQETWV